MPWATFERGSFQLLGDTIVSYVSSPPVVRTFCGRCGTTLTYVHEGRPDEIDVTTATLEDPNAIVPSGHLWGDDALTWERDPPSLPWRPRGGG